MKKTIVIMAMLATLVFAAAARTATTRWVPGTPYFISERHASHWLEQFNDSASCRGLERYGRRGSSPDERYIKFECTVQGSRATCVMRLRSRKDSVRGRYYLWAVRRALTCD